MTLFLRPLRPYGNQGLVVEHMFDETRVNTLIFMIQTFGFTNVTVIHQNEAL
jgi:hypothetical protein